MKHAPAHLHLLFILAVLTGCAGPTASSPEPHKEDVPPFRNAHLKLLVRLELPYIAKDEAAARSSVEDDVVAYFNSLGAADGNTFSAANGEEPNFTFRYLIFNDNGRFWGQVYMSGWGRGDIQTFFNQDSTFSNPNDLIRSLTNKAYVFIHNGWRE
jgi:hypothetical protein